MSMSNMDYAGQKDRYSSEVDPNRLLPPEYILSNRETSSTAGSTEKEGTLNLAESSRILLRHQRAHWPLLSDNFKTLETVETKRFDFDGFGMDIQFNPGRIRSTAAKVDTKSIKERKCFLCEKHLPPEQKGLLYGDFIVLGNPFPIFREHFTIPHIKHIPQLIQSSMEPMLEISKAMSKYYNLFYNGPQCGASAPDHLHFQAGEQGFLPLDTEWEGIVSQHGQWVRNEDRCRIARVDDGLRRFVIFESDDRTLLTTQFERLYQVFSKISNISGTPDASQSEPMLNILCTYQDNRWRITTFLRRKHRPDCYFLEGEEKMTFSPASVDFSGVCILPVERDFIRITPDRLRSMFRELTITEDAMNTVMKDFLSAS